MHFFRFQLLLFTNGLFSDLNLICGLAVLQTAQDADNAMNTSVCTQSDELGQYEVFVVLHGKGKACLFMLFHTLLETLLYDNQKLM